MLAVNTSLPSRIERLAPELLRFLRRRAPESEAEELSQELWLRVHRSEQAFEDDAGLRAYAFVVARRLLVDRARRAAVRPILVAIDGTPEPAGPHSPEAQARTSRLLDVVEDALAAMKPEVAEVWRWRLTEEVSFKEIAERQGCGINTALGRMHQATQALRSALITAGLGPQEDGS